MSSLSEASTHRTTLGMLADRYGYDLSPEFARAVTVTSLANDIDSVTAGTLFMPGKRIDSARIAAASQRGAYAVMLPRSARNSDIQADIPLVFADPTPRELGEIASNMAGNPASTLAVFAVAGVREEQVHANVEMLSQFLHCSAIPLERSAQAIRSRWIASSIWNTRWTSCLHNECCRYAQKMVRRP